MKHFFTILLGLSCIACSPKVYDVRDYGAVGDGVHIDSPAINAAIEAAAQKGGGVILFP